MAAQDRVDQLTEQQKACLRLVLKGMVSKEIAQELGFSPSTVDTYLTSAIARLEVATRRDAARLLAQSEQSQDFISQPGALAPSTSFADPDLPSQGGDNQILRRRPSAVVGRLLSLPAIGGRSHEYSVAQSLAAIFRIALLSSLAFIACVVVIKMGIQAIR